MRVGNHFWVKAALSLERLVPSSIALRQGRYVTVVLAKRTLVDVLAVAAVALVAQVARALERTGGVVAGGLGLHTTRTSGADVVTPPDVSTVL